MFNESSYNDSMFNNIDFGPLKEYLDNDDVTDISYSNNGQLWLKTLSQGVYRAENQNVNNAMIEKIAFQCSNIMGKTFNMAHPTLDAESAELRLNFVHDSIARNGIALLVRKTPAKIRLNKDKIIGEKYITEEIHDFLIKCVEGHCNIVVSGETGSGKTEFVKYLASHTKENEKLITIEDTLELHLDRIFPHRDIVAMKTNNIASYTDILVTCMRQNPKWILLSECRSAEAVMAIRNSISSGHNILSTIHSDKAESIPHRMYSLLESNIDMEQFLKSIYRYVHLGVHIRGYQDRESGSFKREISEVVEFYVDKNNQPQTNIIFRKTADGQMIKRNPTSMLVEYLTNQAIYIKSDLFVPVGTDELVTEPDSHSESSQPVNVQPTIDSQPTEAPVEQSVDQPVDDNRSNEIQPTVASVEQPVQQNSNQNVYQSTYTPAFGINPQVNEQPKKPTYINIIPEVPEEPTSNLGTSVVENIGQPTGE